jgi:hypothetical protein
MLPKGLSCTNQRRRCNKKQGDGIFVHAIVLKLKICVQKTGISSLERGGKGYGSTLASNLDTSQNPYMGNISKGEANTLYPTKNEIKHFSNSF